MGVYPLLRPLIFAIDGERAHRLTIGALKLLPPARTAPPATLPIRVAGIDFPNPVGLAAGFDKDGEVYGQILRLGFGFAEVGTLTPLPQAGNPRPRLFRLAEDRAVINRMGFNNRGQADGKRRLEHRDRKRGIVGINIGANKDSASGDAAIADYALGVRQMGPLADYLTVNISSPNTPGLRALQDKEALAGLLAAVMDARGSGGPPIFLKVAPDLESADVDAITSAAIEHRIDALIVANTTTSRPALRSRHASQSGGLSGAPLAPMALQRLKDFRSATGGALPLIAAGGIQSGSDAYARIRAGASLVQIYSALVYEGPGLARRIVGELHACLRADGFAGVAEAVGAD
jgi:dihydroorotate dehydrogenase